MEYTVHSCPQDHYAALNCAVLTAVSPEIISEGPGTSLKGKNMPLIVICGISRGRIEE